MITPQQFYQGLRNNDGRRVVELVQQLKEQQFKVYATGSSLSRPDYKDVDLVLVADVRLQTCLVSPQELTGELRRRLDLAIYSTLERAVDNEKIIGNVSDNDGSARVEALSNFYALRKSGTYAHSGVSERRKIEFRGTTIDMTLTETPFLMNQDAPRVKL